MTKIGSMPIGMHSRVSTVAMQQFRLAGLNGTSALERLADSVADDIMPLLAEAWDNGAQAYFDWEPQTHRRPPNPYEARPTRGSSEASDD